MTRRLETTIVVAGAGPVGMALAIDAAQRGVDVVVLEARQAGEPPSAKCNTVAARTLETFRRLGVADQVRAAGLPDDYPTDVIYCTSISGYELTRVRQPSRLERPEPGFADSDWATPEPVVRVSQLYLEPILFRRLLEAPRARVLNQTVVEGYEQDGGGVTAHCRASDGEEVLVRGRFLVGCDGGRSTIRRIMGVSLQGDTDLGRTRSSLIRAPALRALFADRRPVWMSWVSNPRIRATVIAIDGEEVWLLHRSLGSRHKDFADLDFDQSIRDALGVGADFTWEVLNHEDWVGRRLVAERFRDGNVFIAGDAAHLWVPFAGYGMNAGVADAMSLSWMLCAVAKGWAPMSFLNAYEAERQPITDQVSRLAIGKVLENTAALGSGPVTPTIEEAGPAGEALRATLGSRLREINLAQFAPAGLNFGYFYDRSPIIAYDGETAPAYDMGSVTPSTVPGCRMPHFWIGPDRSVYDALGPDYTLVRFQPDVDVGPLIAAAEADRLPLTLLDVTAPDAPDVFRHPLLIVRSDQTVAWRGPAPPLDPAALVDRLRGVVAG
ncbi:MAG TPA: FAD-dependent monooxygenase [Caulobacteraceae bacterium]|nr:FAD-dependent monooxygenase [Caulobacteraceae bacterium]